MCECEVVGVECGVGVVVGGFVGGGGGVGQCGVYVGSKEGRPLWRALCFYCPNAEVQGCRMHDDPLSFVVLKPAGCASV